MQFFLRNRLWFLAAGSAWVTGLIFFAAFGLQPWGPMPLIGQVLLWTVVPVLIGTGLLIFLFSTGFVIFSGLGLIWEAVKENVAGKRRKEATFLLIYIAGGFLLNWVFDKLRMPEAAGPLVGFAYFGLCVWLWDR
jgi:hypothetical protein